MDMQRKKCLFTKIEIKIQKKNRKIKEKWFVRTAANCQNEQMASLVSTRPIDVHA